MAIVIDDAREIDASAEQVWQVISDVAAYREWNPFCIECSSTLLPGDPIDMRVRLGKGSPRRQREWMSTHTPGVEFSYRMKPVPLGTLHSLRSHRVTPLGDGRCRYESHFEVRGWLSPLVNALYGTALRAGFGGMTDALVKRALD